MSEGKVSRGKMSGGKVPHFCPKIMKIGTVF